MTRDSSEVERLRSEIATFRDDVLKPSRHGWMRRRGWISADWVAACLDYIISEPVRQEVPNGWRVSQRRRDSAKPRRCHYLEGRGSIVHPCSQILISSTCPIHGLRPDVDPAGHFERDTEAE